MKKRMTIMLVAVGLLLGGIVGYHAFVGYMMKKYMAASPIPPATVSTIKADYQQWQPRLDAVGTLRAVRGIDVTSEVAGLVRSVEFKSGDEVKANQLLIQLNADSDIALQRSLEAAADLAASVYERDKAQFAAEAISKAQLDNDAADLKSRRAQVAQQAAMVDKKSIRAAFAGKLGISTANPGQYVNPGDKLVTLQTIDPIYVDFFLPQQQLPQVSIGQQVTLATNAYPGTTFTGKLSAINPKVDTSTRNVQVEATRAEPEAPAPARACSPRSAWTAGPSNAPDAAAGGHHLQPVRRHRVRGEARRQAGKDDRPSPPSSRSRSSSPPVATRGDQVAISQGRRAGHRSGHQRPDQAQERHADHHRQFSVQPADSRQSGSAGTLSDGR